jgi:sulfofructosephosphate aldolase
MLALDQREAMRLMMADDARPESDGTVPAWVKERVPDSMLTEFKLEAARILSPHASAVLLDKQFCLDAAVEQDVVAPACALMASADLFIPGSGEPVTSAVIDPNVDPETVRRQGAVALKLLVVWREDEPAEPRIAMVRDFVQSCRAHGLISIIEPVARAPRGGGEWDWNGDVLKAAQELGALGADLYKAEVPRKGQGADEEILADCKALNDAIASPWVVLSSGVPADEFPRAVRLACLAGASGFLAGRAVWRACIDATDRTAALLEEGVRRLQNLAEIADAIVQDRAVGALS